MKENIKKEWTEVARRGRHHAILLIASVMESYKEKLYAKYHFTNFNVRRWRQFDGARWLGQDDYLEYQNLFKKKIKNPDYYFQVGKILEKKVSNLRSFIDRNCHINFNKLENSKLLSIFSGYYQAIKEMWVFAYDYIIINTFLPDVILKKVARYEKDPLKQNEILNTLFMAEKESDIVKEKDALLKIVKLLVEKRYAISSSYVKKLIENHFNKFAHLRLYYFWGDPYTKSIIKQRILSYLKKDWLRELKSLEDNRKKVKKINNIFKQLKFDKKTKQLVLAIRRWAYLSNSVDETFNYSVYHFKPFFLTIS